MKQICFNCDWRTGTKCRKKNIYTKDTESCDSFKIYKNRTLEHSLSELKTIAENLSYGDKESKGYSKDMKKHILVIELNI